MRVTHTFACTALAVLVAAQAQAAPQIGAQARQLRVVAASAGPVRLWDTSWWIELQATADGDALQSLDYRARFADDADPGLQSGTFEVSENDAKTVSGRVTVTCAARPDYDRPLRISLRVRDVQGATSKWLEVKFPANAPVRLPAQETVAVQVERPAQRRVETLGSVEVVAGEDMTVGEIRTALQRRARELGGDAAVELAIVESSADRLVLRANVLRYVDVPVGVEPGPTPAPLQLERVLGEITMSAGRR